MSRPAGSRNKAKTEIHPTVTTQHEIGILDVICSNFEKLNDEQRERVFMYLIDKYKEYLPIIENK